jgi:hypothetical protein
MLNIPPDIAEQIKAAICRPEGSFTFKYTSPTAFKRTAPLGILLQVLAKSHLFRLERTPNGLLSFIHSSPGTGTRVASIDLNQLPEFEQAFLAFTWSPQETHFYCGPRVPDADLASAQGTVSSHQFRIGEDGSVFQIGDGSVEVIGISVYEAGRPILFPTAMEAWHNTAKGVEVLWTGESDQGLIYETVTANLTLSILVTGLEAYAKTRFVELETEGITPDTKALFEAFSSKAQRESQLFQEMEDLAVATGKSVFQQIVASGSINFQNYDHIKKAYNRGYGIKIGGIGIASQTLNDFQRFIEYRHHVVHVSPLLGVLNQQSVPPQQPVFANKLLADRALRCFSEFIDKLHEASLNLSRND